MCLVKVPEVNTEGVAGVTNPLQVVRVERFDDELQVLCIVRRNAVGELVVLLSPCVMPQTILSEPFVVQQDL